MSSARACQNGISFCAALDDSDLISLNNGKSTFVNRPNESPLILDLTFISSHLFTSSSHDVWDDALGSDHYPVVTRLGVQVPVSKYYSHKYSLKGINWTLFSSVLEKSNRFQVLRWSSVCRGSHTKLQYVYGVCR